MPKLSSQFKHEEPESNSSLQIKNKKERRAEEVRKMKLAKISHLGAKLPFPAHCSSFQHCSCFLLLTF